MGRGMYYGGGMGMSPAGEIFHVVFGGLCLIILIAIAIIVVRWAIRGGRRGMWHMPHDLQGPGSAMELLKERYAKGEIDKREFDEKKKDLMST
jgi:putative membrane protein